MVRRPSNEASQGDDPRASSSSSSAAASSSQLPRLPACQSCSSRKVKCDSGRPACGPCTKNHTECTITDTATGQQISRAYIHELEQRVHSQRLGSKRPAPLQTDGTPTAIDADTPAKSVDTPSTALHGAGLSFMSSLFTDQEWRNRNSNLLQTLTSASQAAAASPSVEACPLPPSAADARAYFDSYLREDHVQKPILSRAEIEDLFSRVYPNGPGTLPSQNLSRHDQYRAYMIMAVGTVMPFRRNMCQHHPFGYYLSAMQHLNPMFLSSNLSAIQDLLLIARFGIYHHIGTSIWEIVRLCMRMCIEQGLHKTSALSRLHPAHDQMRRRVFWVAYLMDRYSSGTLNRPFAISDHDIEVPLAVDADDTEITAVAMRQPGKTLDELDLARHRLGPSVPSEASVLLLTVRLRQISSDVNDMFSQHMQPTNADSDDEGPLTATGRICEMMDAIVLQLEAWRRTAPVFENPRSLYERPEWYDLLKTREIFNTMRRAVDISPKRNGVPSRYVLTQCLEWAIRIILLYSDLFDRSIVTYTRSYFQMMINAGFSVLYYASVSTPAALGPERAAQCRNVLSRCGETLMRMTVDLADARHYVAVFEALHHHLSNKLKIVQSRRPSPPGLKIDGSSNNAQAESAGLPRTGIAQDGLFHGSGAHDGNNPGQNQAMLGADKGHNRTISGTEQHTGYQPDAAVQNPNVYNHMLYDDHNHLSWTNLQQYQPQHPQHQQDLVGPAADPSGAFNYPIDDPGEYLNWNFLHDEVLWNMGNYVYGDVHDAFGVFEGGHLVP